MMVLSGICGYGSDVFLSCIHFSLIVSTGACTGVCIPPPRVLNSILHLSSKLQINQGNYRKQGAEPAAWGNSGVPERRPSLHPALTVPKTCKKIKSCVAKMGSSGTRFAVGDVPVPTDTPRIAVAALSCSWAAATDAPLKAARPLVLQESEFFSLPLLLSLQLHCRALTGADSMES